ncbi:MAG: Lar family restriction alleviation protein [Clostridia bacterium]|nr:Lar family restriction alleviation protein [Clostridia bacterium]
MSEILKPCPFCGGNVYNDFKTVDGKTQSLIGVYVICQSCDMVMRSEWLPSENSFSEIIEINNKLIERWNRRAKSE